MKSCSSTARGFTLVEMIAAIAVLGIVSTVAITSYVGVQAKSRDDRRVSDMQALLVALESFYNRCHVYPDPGSNVLTTVSAASTCSSVTFGDYLPTVPIDPGTGVGYEYYVNGTNPPSKYILRTKLETNHKAFTDNIDLLDPVGFTLDCRDSNGYLCYTTGKAV